MTDLTRSPLARIALAAWVNVDPDKLPPEKAWIEHPNDDNRQAWERVIAAVLAAAEPKALGLNDGGGGVPVHAPETRAEPYFSPPQEG